MAWSNIVTFLIIVVNSESQIEIPYLWIINMFPFIKVVEVGKVKYIEKIFEKNEKKIKMKYILSDGFNKDIFILLFKIKNIIF